MSAHAGSLGALVDSRLQTAAAVRKARAALAAALSSLPDAAAIDVLIEELAGRLGHDVPARPAAPTPAHAAAPTPPSTAAPAAPRRHTGGKRPDTAKRNAILTALRESPMTAPELVTVIHGSSPDSDLTERQITRMRNTLATMRQEGTVQSVDGRWRPIVTNGAGVAGTVHA